MHTASRQGAVTSHASEYAGCAAQVCPTPGSTPRPTSPPNAAPPDAYATPSGRPIGLDGRGTLDLEQLLVLGTGGLGMHPAPRSSMVCPPSSVGASGPSVIKCSNVAMSVGLMLSTVASWLADWRVRMAICCNCWLILLVVGVTFEIDRIGVGSGFFVAVPTLVHRRAFGCIRNAGTSRNQRASTDQDEFTYFQHG